jgi:hypothetical protein
MSSSRGRNSLIYWVKLSRLHFKIETESIFFDYLESTNMTKKKLLWLHLKVLGSNKNVNKIYMFVPMVH